MTVHERFQKAQAEVHAAEHASDVYGALTDALKGRGRMLEKCVDLEMIHYRTELKHSRNGIVRQVIEESEKETARVPIKQPRK